MLNNQRGIVLPMALFCLALLSMLLAGLLRLSDSEVTIANNHMQKTQARALAESGLEVAIWKANAGEPSPSFSYPVPPMGTADVLMLGGPSTWNIDSTGKVGTARARVTATIFRMRSLVIRAPVEAGAEVQTAGMIDARPGTCGSGSAAMAHEAVRVAPEAVLYPRAPAPPVVQGAPEMDTYSTEEIADLRALAKRQGAYYPGNYSGPPLPGLLFVEGNAAIQSGQAEGWIVAMGSLTLYSGAWLTGLAYTPGDLTIFDGVVEGAARGRLIAQIDGAVVLECAAASGSNIFRYALRPTTYREPPG